MTKIRKALESDMSSAVHVICEAWKDAYVGIVPDADLIKYTDEEYKYSTMLKNFNEGLEVFIASENGKDCGVISFGKCEKDFFEDCAYIMQLYVLPSCQHMGIGKKLMDRIENIIRERGYKRVMLNTLFENKNARTFYEKNGYEFFGTENSPLFTERVVRALYKKELI